MDKLRTISFLKNADKIEPFSGEGHSVDEKYIAIKNNKQYFVKLTNNYINPNLKNIFEEAEIPHTPIVDVGMINEKFYIIQEYCNDKSLRSYLDELTNEEIYNQIFQTSTKYRNLRKMFKDKITEICEYEDFLQYLFMMLNTFHSAYVKSDCFTKENRQILLDLRDYLIENIQVLKKCPCVYGHTDIHPGNFLKSDKGLVSIDYDNTKYANIAVSILWGLLSDNIDNLEKYLSFTSGYLNGLFENSIPQTVIESVNVLFAFMVIRYTIKYLNSDKFDKAEMYIEKTKKYFNNNKINLGKRFGGYHL